MKYRFSNKDFFKKNNVIKISKYLIVKTSRQNAKGICCARAYKIFEIMPNQKFEFIIQLDSLKELNDYNF